MLPPIQNSTTDCPFTVLILNVYYFTVFENVRVSEVFVNSFDLFLPSLFSPFPLLRGVDELMWYCCKAGKPGVLFRNNSVEQLDL